MPAVDWEAEKEQVMGLREDAEQVLDGLEQAMSAREALATELEVMVKRRAVIEKESERLAQEVYCMRSCVAGNPRGVFRHDEWERWFRRELDLRERLARIQM